MRDVGLATALGLLAALAIGCGSSITTVSPGGDGGKTPICDGPCPADSSADSATDSGAPSDGAATCSTNAECASFMQCTPGGVAFGCGICAMPQNPCSTDSDCKLVDDAAPPKPMVCGSAGSCVCPVGGKSGTCIPACQSAADCTPDEACGPTGHCEAKSCTTDAECPSTQTVDFACSAGTCARKSCKTSADCGAHYCVDGTCYPQAGMCAGPAA